MAKYVRYVCPKCKTTVEMRDSDDKVNAFPKVACPRLGCSSDALLIWWE